MNLKTINVIIGREYMTRVKKKSFLLTTFLAPIFLAAMMILPSVIMFMAEDKGKQVAVIDESGIVMPFMQSSDVVTYQDFTGRQADSVKTQLADLGLDALVLVSPLDSVAKTVTVSAYSVKPMSMDMKEGITRYVNDAVENYRLESYQIEGLKQIMDDIEANVSVSTYTLGEDGEARISSSEVYMIISLLFSIIIYMFIAMFSGMVMTSVIEEKSSRVVEVLVSSVKATELMFGKIIGVACVALTQFFLWIVLTGVLVAGAGAVIGFDKIAGSATVQTEQMNAMTEGLGVDAADMNAMTMPEINTAESEMGAIMQTLMDINYPMLLISFVIYFILGYLLYASLFAAIGSAGENEADTQQLQIPVTVPLLLAFFIAFYAFKAPDSQLVFWGSMIPFTSPIVMLARIPFGVATWEIVVSVVLLVLTFAAMAWLSAKIYKIGILMYGKKTTFKDLYKWLKQK